MSEVKDRKHLILDDMAEPQFLEDELDTGAYIPDNEAIRVSIEKNRAIIASLGGEFAELVKD